MVSLSIVIGFYLVVIALGKQVQRPKPGTYVYVALVALAQTMVVLIQMLYTDLPMF